MSKAGRPAGVTLIEMLLVIAIIGILAGLFLAAVNSAKTRARIRVAEAEVADLAKAWKQYWMMYETWPPGYADGTRPMNDDAMKILAGKPGRTSGTNPQGIKFIDIDEKKWLGGGYKDPWGRVYQVVFSDVTRTPGLQEYRTVIHFPNKKRFDYENP